MPGVDFDLELAWRVCFGWAWSRFNFLTFSPPALTNVPLGNRINFAPPVHPYHDHVDAIQKGRQDHRSTSAADNGSPSRYTPHQGLWLGIVLFRSHRPIENPGNQAVEEIFVCFFQRLCFFPFFTELHILALRSRYW